MSRRLQGKAQSRDSTADDNHLGRKILTWSVRHPWYGSSFVGAVAQLVRAPPCHGGGCGFEPRQLRGISRKTPRSEAG